MREEKLILMLEEGLSLEEIPILAKLDEIEGMINKINFDKKTKRELIKKTNHLKKETIKHSGIFSDLIKHAIKK